MQIYQGRELLIEVFLLKPFDQPPLGFNFIGSRQKMVSLQMALVLAHRVMRASYSVYLRREHVTALQLTTKQLLI